MLLQLQALAEDCLGVVIGLLRPLVGRLALDILADLFPDRDAIGIYSGDLIWGFGAMHCMTQQQPVVGR